METTVKYLSALKASKTWFDDPAIQISLPPGRSPVVGDDIPPWPGCEIDLGYRRGSETCGKLRNALCQWRGGANKRLGSPPGFLARFNSPAKSLLTPLFLLVPGVFQTRRASKVQQEESILANSVKSHPWRRFVTAGSVCRERFSGFVLRRFPSTYRQSSRPISTDRSFEKRPPDSSIRRDSLSPRVRRNFIMEIKIAITRGTRGSKFRKVFRVLVRGVIADAISVCELCDPVCDPR